MVFKCGASIAIQSLSLNSSAESVDRTNELKIQKIQMITNDFNGSNSLCFCKSFLIFWVSI